MNEIVWLAHGGPGSGRYPKGSGKKYLKTMNRYSRGYTRANYYRLKNQNRADRFAKNANFYDIHNKYGARERAIKKQLKYDTKAQGLANVMAADKKKIESIQKRLTKSMNIPLKTIQRSTVVGGYPIFIPPFVIGGGIVTSKYTKYKVDKKALKNG